jgi:Cd2+/Zn2+-exporting ATPase
METKKDIREEKIDTCCGPATTVKAEASSGDHDHHHDHSHEHATRLPAWREHLDLLSALAIVIILLTLEFAFSVTLPWTVSFAINAVAYFLAGWNVLRMAFRKLSRADIFNEFVLMSVATLGAFAIGEYTEGVAVMVFYSIGEWFQDSAVKRARASIKALLDIRPDEVTVLRNGKPESAVPASVRLGETILVKPGEKVALDGELVSESASFNTSALTGESKPDTKRRSEPVLAGMINLTTVAEVKVNALFRDSKLSRILEMVQEATARKSQTQLFISRFAKVYTPIVFFLALGLVIVPFFFDDSYVFREWLYRALVFLVISCPCALVVSIPLGYFGGIGLASRNGILFKGGNFLDVMTKVDTVVMDKTGTLTKGVFKVTRVEPSGVSEEELVRNAVALEKNSTHPVGKAILEYAQGVYNDKATGVEEISGHGLRGTVNGKTVLAGNAKLMEKFSVSFPQDLGKEADTTVIVAIENKFAGYFVIADEVRDDSAVAVKQLHRLRLTTVMLSGDRQSVVDKVAASLGIDEAYGELLPEDKVEKVRSLKEKGRRVAFVGDGVNDAPVIALADVGIAMGGLGSDAAIETADVVIQNDQPSKIAAAIRIGSITRDIVWQNIILAMAVKGIVLLLGAGGVANLWEAVIADVGVALLAILNAVRIQSKTVNLKSEI